MKKVFITLTFFIATHVAMAQDAFKSDVMKVIEMSGATGPMQLAKEQIMQNIPLTKRADFSKEFDASLPSLYNKLAVVYMATYTHEDIKELLKFYESPIGKKMADSAGELFKKSTVAGQEWGMELQSMMMKYMQ